MRSVIVIVLTLVSSIPVIAQDTEGNVRKEVEALHKRWKPSTRNGSRRLTAEMVPPWTNWKRAT